MSPDIEAVHRLLLDQKASSKKLFSARASSTWHVVKCAYIFNPGVECGQTLHWEVPDRVHPRVPPRLSHCLFPGLSGLPQEACSPRMKAHPKQVFFFFLAITSVTKKQRSYTLILVNTTISQKCVAIIWDQLEQNGRNGSLRFTVTLHWQEQSASSFFLASEFVGFVNFLFPLKNC